ncbi:hypothetical protein [Clostridioides sp. ES-S-0108-01]|uniref:hypothetical protein n=1 Tax=Clostridioides sp. ES-S-0108-01 TaxID=2770773 RepID=UPI001D0C9A5D|nr:hypothetical protein JJC16_10970 [Clostridioides sp. ES-S-0107-01]
MIEPSFELALGVIVMVFPFCCKVAFVLLDSKVIPLRTPLESVNVILSPTVTCTS